METIVEGVLDEMYGDLVEESLHTIMRNGRLITPDRRAELRGPLADDVNIVKTTFNSIANDRSMVAHHGTFVIVKQSLKHAGEGEERQVFWENMFDLLDKLFKMSHPDSLHDMINQIRLRVINQRRGAPDEVVRGLVKFYFRPHLISLVDRLSTAINNHQSHRFTDFGDMW